MIKFVILALCLSVFGNVFSLKCYKCENCEIDDPKTWAIINCGIYHVPVPDPYVWSCLTIDFNNKTTSREEQVRKCVLSEKNDGELTFNCPMDIGEIRSCKICETDLCS